jgi:nucleoside-diphosphate-sugar epimerase
VKKELSLLIIGGTGFFGKSILDSFKRGLLNEYNITKILVLARNTDKFKLEFPELFFNGVELINGDISTISSLPKTDFIIHAASSTNMTDYKYIYENKGRENIENAVTNFCNLASKFHLRSKIIYCSSGAVYGKQPLNIEKIDEDFMFEIDLKDFTDEKKAYCLGKRYAEKEFIKLGKLGLNVSIARCFAFSGKYLPKDQHYAMGNFIGEAEKGNNVIVKAPGIIYRSYMDADELVKSLFLLVNIASPNCPIFNIGSDQQISLYDLAESIAIKYNVSVEFDNLNKSIVIDRYVPNIDKLKKILIKQV